MSGVDHVDQMLGSYAYCHKSVKWYHTVFHRIQEIALTKGYIVYKFDKVNGHLGHAKFRKQVADGLLSEYVPIEHNSSGRPSSKPLPDRMTGRHFSSTYDRKNYKPDREVRSDRERKQRHQCNTYCKGVTCGCMQLTVLKNITGLEIITNYNVGQCPT